MCVYIPVINNIKFMKSIFFITSLFFFSFSIVSGQILGGQIKNINKKCGAYTEDGTFIEFACYNLGADPVNGDINGDLYQWGRPTDGHEKRDSQTVTTQATNDDATLPIAVNGKFIIGYTDWRSTSTNTLWQEGTKTANDPCPDGFKVPSYSQWVSILNYFQQPKIWTGNGYFIGTEKLLYLPAAGTRNYSSGSIEKVGTYGYYWCNTINTGSINPYLIYFYDAVFLTAIYDPAIRRASGASIRCIAQ
jgi:uncharacterized protein (TIGR02145 family)